MRFILFGFDGNENPNVANVKYPVSRGFYCLHDWLLFGTESSELGHLDCVGSNQSLSENQSSKQFDLILHAAFLFSTKVVTVSSVTITS